MLKALQILKEMLEQNQDSDCINELKEAISEIEALETRDSLAELEKVILDYYLNNGYQLSFGGWGFKVKIETDYNKDKKLIVQFRESYLHDYLNCFTLYCKGTTKEMFDKAFEYFTIKEPK